MVSRPMCLPHEVVQVEGGIVVVVVVFFAHEPLALVQIERVILVAVGSATEAD